MDKRKVIAITNQKGGVSKTTTTVNLGVDLVPSNIGLSGFEVSLVNTMSREFVLRSYLGAVKRSYSHRS